MRKLCLGCGLALLIIASAFAQKLSEKKSADPSKPADTAKSADASEPVRKTLRAYAEAFNKNDAKAAAAFWAPKGVYVDRDTGERSEGREAIEADLATLFKENRGARLSASVANVRFVTPGVAMVEGAATVFRPGEDPNETSFAAVLVKQDATWLIDSVHETDTPSPPTAADALKDLEFLVGHWRDKTDGVRVDTLVRWSAQQAFLIRSYTVEREQAGEHEGTQVIGWDPREKRIRSWTFDSDGSFGEETWTKVDGDWIVKLTRTLADGGTSSGTQVISIKDDNTLTVKVLSSEVDGEPGPAGEEVTVVRVDEKDVEKEATKVGATKTSEKIIVEKTVIEKAPATAPRKSPR
jgi:uncharacterized protein (TIGR02246 family)